MATRRTAAKTESSNPPPANGSINGMKNELESPPLRGSPFLPTALEACLLATYPATLLFGSLYSTIHHGSWHATYSPVLQSYDPNDAPSYFAKKSNLLNVYFVKIGWFWVTLAFFTLIFSHSSLGRPLSGQITRRRLQAILRYACVTTIWIFVTQWFFGPAIIDRSFRWTGGKCEAILDNDSRDSIEQAEAGDLKQALSHAACKSFGGQWRGGHDISGHVFLLILGSAMLWLELLPAVLQTEGLREARRIFTSDGLIRRATIESDGQEGNSGEKSKEEKNGIGIQVSLAVAGLSWWMLLMTAAYFHTWFEKVTGLMVAFTAVYSIYFLPRALPALRQILGMPGV